MSVITPVGGLLGPRPTGAAFRTGVWKQPEVYQRRIDGVWVTPTYPDLAPYATNSSGHILVGTYIPKGRNAVGSTQTTRDYVRPRKIYSQGGLCLDDTRWSYLYTQAVTNNLNWRFDLRYWDEPTGSNIFGLTVQTGNVKRVSTGMSCHNANNFRIDYDYTGGTGDRYMYHDEASSCSATGQDYHLLGMASYYSAFAYSTQLAVSSSRFPFGTAPFVNTDNGIDNYYAISQANRPVSMWLIPP